MTSFNTGVSGLRSAQTSLNTTAHNIANNATAGYTRQSALITDFTYVNSISRSNKLAQIGLGSDVSKIRQIRNTYLDAQYRLQFGRQSFYETQKSAMDEIEDLFGELEGEEFFNAISDLYEALNEISKTPDDIVTRDQLISIAGCFIEKAQVLKEHLDDYQMNLNTEILSQVNRINEITAEISEWNNKIQRYEAKGEDANDFRDTRNLLLDELSRYVKIDVKEELDGTISVYSEAGYLVTADQSYELATAKINESTNMLKVVWKQNKRDYFLSGNQLTYSTENDSDVGSLRAITIVRGSKVASYTDTPIYPNKADYTDTNEVFDELAYKQALIQYQKDTEVYNKEIAPSIIMKTQAQLELYINKIATTLNDVLCPNIEVIDEMGNKIKILDTENASVGDDINKTIGVELFTRKSVERYTLKTIKLADGTEMEAYVYNEEDPNDVLSMYTLDQLTVNPELLKNSSMLPLNANDESGYADGFARLTAEALVSAWNNTKLQLSPNDLTTYSFSKYYTAMTGEMAIQGKVWNSMVEHQTLLASNMDDNRQMVMGVSSDEELANLVRFQHCYNASSRYITVIDELLKHIIERL